MFVGYLNLPNLVTFAGLTISLLACLLSFRGELALALICLMMAGILDLFDGLLAKRMERSLEESMFGVQIDTIADMACFGVAPVIIAMHSGLSTPVDFISQAFYGCCAATRLAYFNIYGTSGKDEAQYYTGLPVTYAALIFPLVFMPVGLVESAISHNIVRGSFVLAGVMFVLRAKVFKPKGVSYLVFPLIALLLSFYWFLRM